MMMKKSAARGHGALTSWFAFLLIAIFAVLSLMIVLVGAQAYRNVVNGAEENARSRVLVSYVANKLRINDGAGDISINTDYGLDMLVIEHDYDGDIYQTKIYCFDGYLRESFAGADWEFSLGDGERLAEANSFNVSYDNGLYHMQIETVEGDSYIADVALRSGV